MLFQDKVMLSSRKASMLESFMWKTFFFFACQRRRFRQKTVIIECWTLITGLLFFLIFRILEEVLCYVYKKVKIIVIPGHIFLMDALFLILLKI